MKSFRITCIFTAIFSLSCAVGKAAPAESFAVASNEVWSTFDAYVVQKHDLARDMAKKHGVEMPAQVEKFFAAAQKRDWTSSTNLFLAIREEEQNERKDTASNPYHFWGAVQDTWGAFEVFHWMNPKFAKMFGREIVQGIPPGSIYFGGTDGGRFLVSAFSKSHSQGLPFYTITQNALADPSYLAYVADMYGDKIHVADTNDSQKCFEDYKADVRARLLHDQMFPNQPRQIRPGENASLDTNGNVQVSGQVSVMALNALISKMIFDKNPTNEFYVEESFPLDWMFPHLTPNGFIMKINRAAVPELTDDMVKRDHAFWAKAAERLVGNWITYDTPVTNLTAFAEKVYLRHDYGSFKGDEDFLRDNAAQRAFSKLRSSIAGIYSWRLGVPPSGGAMPKEFIASGANRALMEHEADFAFKQAVAFCPTSPEAVFRYVQFLVDARRMNDALAIAEMAQTLDPKNTSFEALINNLKRISSQSGGMSQNKEELEAEVANLEKNVKPGSTNFVEQFELAQKLIQLGENDRAFQVLDDIVANPHTSVPVVMSVANAYNHLGQPARLLKPLEALTRLAPDSPEAWYDLATWHATFGQKSPALDCLKKALELNSKRLKKDAKAPDIRSTLEKDKRLDKLRDTPEFKAIVEKK